MSKEVLASKYRYNESASIKKHIFSRLFDYFLTFVTSYILFVLVYSLGFYLPGPASLNEKLTNASDQVSIYIGKTELQSFSNNRLSSLEDDAAIYIKKIVKTSAYIHNLHYPVKNTDGTYDTNHYVPIEETFVYEYDEFKNDNLGYYYFKFKADEPGLESYVYEEVDYKNDKWTYLYNKIMGYDGTYFVDEDFSAFSSYKGTCPRYICLTNDSGLTQGMINRLVYNDESSSKIAETYSYLKDAYIKAAEYGIKDVETNSTEYLALMDVFVAAYDDMLIYLFVAFIITFIIAYLILLFLGRLIGQEWITIGQKLMKLAMCNIDDMEIRSYKYVLYHFINILLFITGGIATFYFNGLIGVLSLEILGPINILMIMLFFLVFDIISFVFIFVTKDHHDFSTFLCRIVVKDTTEYMVSPNQQLAAELDNNGK